MSREWHAKKPDNRQRLRVVKLDQDHALDHCMKVRASYLLIDDKAKVLVPELQRDTKLREVARKLGVAALTVSVLGFSWLLCEAFLRLFVRQ